MDKLHNGIELYLSGDLYGAIRELKEYIDGGGVSKGTAYFHLGMIYSDRQLLTDACDYFKKAVELEPGKSMYHYRLGVVYSRLMILDSAIIELQKSIDLNPEHQRSRYILGTIYFQKGDMDMTHKVFSGLIKVSPDFADAYYYRGLASYHRGDNDGAILDFNKALELNPSYDDAKIKLAVLYYHDGNYTKSAKLYSDIYDNGVRDWLFIHNYIKALHSAGSNEKAQEVVREALLLYPHNQELQRFLEEKEI